MAESELVQEAPAPEALVLSEDHGDWALVTLNRPAKRNAMNRAARTQFRHALRRLRDKRVVVLTGAGPAFCAGMDLTEVDQMAHDGSLGDALFDTKNLIEDGWPQCNEDIRQHPAVFIAAVNGFALGGGSTLINNCELAIAATSASIGVPEVGFGTWPGLAGPALINRMLPKHAAELILLAKRVDAQTAYRMGMVNEVIADADLLTRARQMAEHIAQFDPTTLTWAKRAFNRMINMSWDESQDFSSYIAAAIQVSRPTDPEGFTLTDFANGKRGSGQGA